MVFVSLDDFNPKDFLGLMVISLSFNEHVFRILLEGNKGFEIVEYWELLDLNGTKISQLKSLKELKKDPFLSKLQNEKFINFEKEDLIYKLMFSNGYSLKILKSEDRGGLKNYKPFVDGRASDRIWPNIN